MAKRKKPTTRDFIVAAIRRLRPRPSNLKSGNAAGVRLSKVYNVALAVYTDQEFRQGLKLAMNDEGIVIHGKVRTQGDERGHCRHKIISSIAKDVPLDSEEWNLDKSGNPVNTADVDIKEYEHVWEIRACVIADGLPITVRRIFASQSKNSERSLAQEIIDSM